MDSTSLILSLDVCYKLNWVPYNSYVEALTPNVTVFEDRAIKELIKLNKVVEWGFNLRGWVFLSEVETSEISLSLSPSLLPHR